MKRMFFTIVISLALALAWAVAVSAADPTSPPPADDAGPVYVESAAVRAAGTDEPESELIVSAAVPTPCHEAVWEVEHAGDAVRVWLWSVRTTDDPCIAVLEPVQLSIALGTIDPDVPVLLDGRPVTGSVDVDAGGSTTLAGAGWSFGMCLGYCVAELELEEESAVLTGSGHGDVGELFVNGGQLTTAGLERLAAATSGLDISDLEPVYGCPDCADGGAAYVSLTQHGVTSRHDMEFGAPPEPLAAVEALAMQLIGTLETCGASELITVGNDCSPYVP